MIVVEMFRSVEENITYTDGEGTMMPLMHRATHSTENISQNRGSMLLSL